jgi:formate hydrogenlyase transcriptional activator
MSEGRKGGFNLMEARLNEEPGEYGGDWRYRVLLEVMDLAALHTRVDELLPDLASSLRKVVAFDAVGLVLPRRGGGAGDVYTVLLPAYDAPPSATVVEVVRIPPIGETQLAGLLAAAFPLVVHDLDTETDYHELLSPLREAGKRSACLLPLATALQPVGTLGLASTQTGAFDDSDQTFLDRLASQVAVAIENVRHHEEAQAYQHQLEAERDHWRTLLEFNNAVVTKLDLASLLANITPSLRRMVAHDFTSLELLDTEGKPALMAFDPALPAWVEEVSSSLKLEETPLGRTLTLRKPLDVDLAQLPPLSDSLQQRVAGLDLRRACFVPLLTARRALGGLFLARRAPAAFTADELERAFQAGGQIAIALENALAFKEIAGLRDRLAQENVYLEAEIRGKERFEEIIGESKALQRVLAQVRRVAPMDTAVLLLGETGTGKELIARAIHALSDRRSRTLVTVNCATSPAGLLESEWFGHEKGAFTGALGQKTGRFELANQGTLFLDEIGDVPLDLQSKLLRALQEHEVERLGSNRTIHVDFRLIAATNRNLAEMVANRQYRADLYYRLNVFPIRIPPLRERREDIPPLVRHFVQWYAKRLRRTIDAVARESMEALCRWHWPGNVRELQNVIERAVILCQGPTLRVPLSELQTPDSVRTGGALTLEGMEREHILQALEESEWVIGGRSGAAARLGLKRTTLVSTMRRLGIVRPRPGAAR